MIRFNGLEKKYGSFTAVHPLRFEVPRGEIFGFLGPNGAGKTSTIRMMMGILAPSSGSVEVAGLDCHRQAVEVKRRIGYLPDQPAFYDYLRGRELLEFVGEMHGYGRKEASQRSARVLETFGLREAAEEFAVNYSLGMKKRLGLALATVHDPDVLLLDEPVNGLDPRAAAEVNRQLLEFARNGRTVFLSTHLLAMAERLCTRVGIIHQGQLLAVGSPASLQERFLPGGSLEELFLRLTDGHARGLRPHWESTDPAKPPVSDPIGAPA